MPKFNKAEEMDVTKTQPACQTIPVLCLVLAVAAAVSSVILWYQNVTLATDLDQIHETVLEMRKQLQTSQESQGGEPTMRMGTGSGYRVEAGRRLRRAVADSDGSRGDSEGERTGDPPETVTRQEFQGVVKRVRRLATAHNGCEERLEELEAWQDYQGALVHFYAGEDQTTAEQLSVTGFVDTESGHWDRQGLTPSDGAYRFWKAAQGYAKRTFTYNNVTGHVTVRNSGIYLVYAQVVYRGVVPRNSYGIYIGDSVSQPAAQCLAYDMSQIGHRRHHGSQPTGNRFQQCSTVTVQHIPTGTHIYIRGMYQGRTLLPRPPLTFWGIARLA